MNRFENHFYATFTCFFDMKFQVLSLTLPPAPQPVSEYLPPQPRLTGLFPGGKEGSRPCKIQTNHFTVELPRLDHIDFDIFR